MVALAIIALSLTGLSLLVVDQLDKGTLYTQRTYASWIAQNRIAEIRLQNDPVDVSSRSGEVEYAGASWAWRADISATEVEDLYRIDVGVSLLDPDKPNQNRDVVIRTVTGFIGPPQAQGSGNQVWGLSILRQGNTS